MSNHLKKEMEVSMSEENAQHPIDDNTKQLVEVAIRSAVEAVLQSVDGLQKRGKDNCNCDWHQSFRSGICDHLKIRIPPRAAFLQAMAGKLRDHVDPLSVADLLDAEADDVLGEWVCLINPATGKSERFYVKCGCFQGNITCFR